MVYSSRKQSSVLTLPWRYDAGVFGTSSYNLTFRRTPYNLLVSLHISRASKLAVFLFAAISKPTVLNNVGEGSIWRNDAVFGSIPQ